MNIYISNLSFDVNDGDLMELFGEYGQVSSARVVMDRETGKSRGFAFVEMADNESANKAIGELNQAEYDGRVIRVAEARPKEERGAGEGGQRNNNRGPRRFNNNNSNSSEGRQGGGERRSSSRY